MVRLFSFIFFILIFSCSIIEDSDITSKGELDNLKLKSIEIKQSLGSGTTTSLAIVTSIVAVDNPVTNGRVTKQVWMSWPVLGSNKLRFRSGFNEPSILLTSFLETGDVYNVVLYDEDTVVQELYRFRYDEDGRLSKIITFIPELYADLPASNDTLIYDTGGRLVTVERRSDYSANAGNFTWTNDGMIDQFTFKSTNYYKACQGSGCGPWFGGNYHAIPVSGGQPLGILNLTDSERQYFRIDDKNDVDTNQCGNCATWADTIYFHPLFLFQDDVQLGSTLLFLYLVDWWKPSTGQPSGNNEKVTFSFRYDL